MDTIDVDTLQVVQRYICMVSIPICLVCGTFGNIVSFIVYIRKWSSSTIPLVFLSCFDLLFLWTDSVFSGSMAYFGYLMETRPYGCAIVYYLCMAMFFGSTFVVAMFSLMRAYSVVRPLMFGPTFPTRRTLYMASILTAIAFAMESHIIFGFYRIPHHNTTIMYRAMACELRPQAYNTFYFDYWVNVETVISMAGLGAILIGNVIVIISLLRRKPIGNSTMDTSQISRRLIAVSIAQVLVWSPWIVLSIMAFGLDRDIGSIEDRLLMVLMEVALDPLRIQSGFGFFIYTVMGSEHRAEFKKILSCRNNRI